MGFLFAVIAGAAMSVQGVMNTRLSEKIGLYESNAWVQGTAFILSLLAVWILGKGDFAKLGQTPKYTLLGGALGLVITVTVMLAIGLMRLLYPRDRRTLGVLRRKLKQISCRPEC